jgi:hypothetical protein
VEATGKHEETTHGETMSVSQFHPSDLIGVTKFLINEQEDIQEDGQRFHERIVQDIKKQHENKHAKESELHKVTAPTNGNNA